MASSTSNARLERRTFERILEVLKQLKLDLKSPKFFVIYAHDNDALGIKAHQKVVQDYISWFKMALFNVDSDRSPHGYGIYSSITHEGATTNILKNQACLLPRSWHDGNVDYVLVFYSKLLATYMKDEREFPKLNGLRYFDAISGVCEKYVKDDTTPFENRWDEITEVQKIYSKHMGTKFHHCLTELALLKFRNRHQGAKYTIPILLEEDMMSEELKWKPEFVATDMGDILNLLKHEKQYQAFFKILLEFETLNDKRDVIESLRDCFRECTSFLQEDVVEDIYMTRVETQIFQHLNKRINSNFRMMNRPLTVLDIRSVLDLRCLLDHSSLRRISGEKIHGKINDIRLRTVEELKSAGGNNVPLHGLFDKRKIKGEQINPRRILIQGRPGIGKTTLSRRIMYEYSWHENLKKKFELVVRVPVRKLGYFSDLSDLLFDEYFQTVPRGRELSNMLRDLILAKAENVGNANILVILDGLDEAQAWQHQERKLLQVLTKHRLAIMTSRSFSDETSSIDLHLEALGLDLTDVWEYIDNEVVVSAANAKDIRGFVETNPFVEQMVRVPIHLDILCYSWGELQEIKANGSEEDHETAGRPFKHKDDPPTITALYQAVVQTLFRRDIPKLDKVDHGERVTADIVEAVVDAARLERLLHAEIQVLALIAADMMTSGRFEFTSDDVSRTISYMESKDTWLPLSLERNLVRLSILLSHSYKKRRIYSFVHLTFQEFFASRCMVQDRDSLRNHLRNHKYDRRYEVIWRFVPGLMQDAQDLNVFFQLLEQEPRDIVGKRHVHLLMNSFSECRFKTDSGRQDKILRALEEWYELELSLEELFELDIGTYTAFPEDILFGNLFSETTLSPERFSRLMYTLGFRESLSKDFLHRIVEAALAANNRASLGANWPSEESKISETIHFFLSNIGWRGLSDNTMALLLNTVRDDSGAYNTDYQGAAKNSLHNLSDLPDHLIDLLEKWLSSTDDNERWLAASIFGGQSKLPPRILDLALTRFIAEPANPLFRKTIEEHRDLNDEAVDKLLGLFEEAVGGAEVPGDFVVLVLSRRHNTRPLHSRGVATLSKVLRSSMDTKHETNSPSRGEEHFTDLIKAVLEVLDVGPRNLPIDMQRSLVHLLLHKDGDISGKAGKLLRGLADLPKEIVEKLREVFQNHQWQALSAIEGQISLEGEMLKFVAEHLTDENEAVRSKAIKSLRGQSGLPEDIMIKLARSLPKDKGDISDIVSHQKNLQDCVVEAFNDAFNKYGIWGTERIYGRSEFVPFLLKEIKGQRGHSAGSALDLVTNLDDKSIKTLETMAFTGSPIAARVLCKRPGIPIQTTLSLHDAYLSENGLPARYLWRNRPATEFYINLETILNSNNGESITQKFIKDAILNGGPEDYPIAYIDGYNITFHDAYGEQQHVPLEHVADFRERYRRIQNAIGIPEWARVSQSNDNRGGKQLKRPASRCGRNTHYAVQNQSNRQRDRLLPSTKRRRRL
ncbi:hypothetical protein F5Y14DRAFT_295194 [Nemania sp. NC0429]|nr:hypothetical protein F5Y14DRAFT_295194 [Nemania sp. NC0429]